jgi:PleD family two-component response regulator
MSEEESEAETLDRLEQALMRIATQARSLASAGSVAEPSSNAVSGAETGLANRHAIVSKLDEMISRLRSALDQSTSA